MKYNTSINKVVKLITRLVIESVHELPAHFEYMTIEMTERHCDI